MLIEMGELFRCSGSKLRHGLWQAFPNMCRASSGRQGGKGQETQKCTCMHSAIVTQQGLDDEERSQEHEDTRKTGAFRLYDEKLEGNECGREGTSLAGCFIPELPMSIASGAGS